MKRNALFVLMILMAMMSFILNAEVPVNVRYLFPKDGATLIAKNTNIVLKPGSVVEQTQIASDEMFVVQGSKSGLHQGRIVLARDQETILFYPDIPFESDEEVRVRINSNFLSAQGKEIKPFDFRFQTTPLDTPLNPYEHLESLKTILPKDKPLSKSAELPNFNITLSGETAPGNLFLAPTKFFSADGYLLMTNDNGDILFQEALEETVPFDFKLQPNGLLSYGLLYEYFAFTGGGYTDFFVMDSTYSVVDEFQMGNGYIADFHDFQYLPNGHCLLFAYDLQPMDMSQIVEDGRPDALVAGSIIQELDLDKNVVFQWRSWDYFDLADSYNDLTLKNFDAVHINSLEVADDGNLIVSALALGEVTKINRQTGEIIWRLGGKNNEFTFINESEEFAPLYFMFQHDVRSLPNGNITMFDNGAAQFGREYSRVVEYDIDINAMTATKVWEYRHNPDIFVPTMGNAQRLPNGNTLVGWGFASLKAGVPMATEVNASGNVVMEINCDDGFGSYRVLRYPYDGGKPDAKVVVFEVQEGNTYEFVDDGNTHEFVGDDVILGLTVTLLEKPGFGYNEMIGYRYNYGPSEPDFPEQAPMVVPMRFVLDQFAIDQLRLEMSFDAEFLKLNNPDQITIYYRMFEGRNMFFPLETTYNPVTKELKAVVRRTGLGSDDEIGEFIFTYPVESSKMLPPILNTPVSQNPINQNNPVELSWSARGYANYYDLQVAKDSLFITLIVDEFDLMEGVYTLSDLDPETQYFWRIRASTDLDTSDWTAASFITGAPFIEITSPVAENVWSVGLKYFIEWNDNLEEDVIIQLFNNDELNSIIDTVESIGAYRWEVPFNLPLGDQYEIRIQSLVDQALYGMSGYFAFDTSGTIEPEVTDYHLHQNAPNPIMSSTVIQFDLPVDSHVLIEVFNILGQAVSTPVNDWFGPGRKQVTWQPKQRGTGLYFYCMTAKPWDSDAGYSEYYAIRKMIVIK
ncbi:arylsulfotransferase family protein [bacterium]